jgi:hypothetical protein
MASQFEPPVALNRVDERFVLEHGRPAIERFT